MEDVPRIFEAVFQCTLEVSTTQVTSFCFLFMSMHDKYHSFFCRWSPRIL